MALLAGCFLWMEVSSLRLKSYCQQWPLASHDSYWAVLSCDILFFMRFYKEVLIFKFVGKIQKCNQLNGWAVVLSICYAVNDDSLPSRKIIECGHSSESYWAVLSCGTVYYAAKGTRNFLVCAWNPYVRPFKWKLKPITFLPINFSFSILQNKIICLVTLETIQLQRVKCVLQFIRKDW